MRGWGCVTDEVKTEAVARGSPRASSPGIDRDVVVRLLDHLPIDLQVRLEIQARTSVFLNTIILLVHVESRHVRDPVFRLSGPRVSELIVPTVRLLRDTLAAHVTRSPIDGVVHLLALLGVGAVLKGVAIRVGRQGIRPRESVSLRSGRARRRRRPRRAWREARGAHPRHRARPGPDPSRRRGPVLGRGGQHAPMMRRLSIASAASRAPSPLGSLSRSIRSHNASQVTSGNRPPRSRKWTATSAAISAGTQ